MSSAANRSMPSDLRALFAPSGLDDATLVASLLTGDSTPRATCDALGLAVESRLEPRQA